MKHYRRAGLQTWRRSYLFYYWAFVGVSSGRWTKARAFSLADQTLLAQKQQPHIPSRKQHHNNRRLLIHWKGEDVEGYSIQFRQVEFAGALAAVATTIQNGTATAIIPADIRFENALEYNGTVEMPSLKVDCYNQAMQYIHLPKHIPMQSCMKAVERCSLIHALYEVVAEVYECNEDDYKKLSEFALKEGGFDDLVAGNPNGNQTWCVRVRHYGKNSDANKERRYGARARSLTMERQALQELTPLLLSFGGRVDLKNPDCKIFVFDGLKDFKKILARQRATGPRTFTLNPNTRICSTNTPLCPIASYSLCNVAQIQRKTSVLDVFAGSCAILLAAASIEPTCSLVGIEIAHNGLVNRNDIRRDFQSRNLTQPVALIHGDARDPSIRARARARIDSSPFDCIITDPPYGIRESTGLMERPIDELFKMIADDRALGTPLLKQGGRLVTFLPQQTEEESLDGIMPTEEQTRAAGLRFELMREQPLNDILSRWLVSFVCIE